MSKLNPMCRRIRNTLLFVAFAFSIPAQGQSRIDCNALESRILKHPVHYCVYLPASYDASAARHPVQLYPVLYYLHGLGDNERTLFNTGGWTLLDDLRQQHKIGEFLIAAPEGGQTFYINSADGSVRYSDFFLQEFIPLIEGKYRVKKERASRAMSGISMGGYGALRFAFAHPELFSAVSAQSAALMSQSPQELDRAVRSGAPLGKVLGNVFLATRSRSNIGTATVLLGWPANTSPRCGGCPFISIAARTTTTVLKKAPPRFTSNYRKRT